MAIKDWVPLVILLFGCLFLLVSFFYQWLSVRLRADTAHPEGRVLSFVLGLVLLSLWAIWRSVGEL